MEKIEFDLPLSTDGLEELLKDVNIKMQSECETERLDNYRFDGSKKTLYEISYISEFINPEEQNIRCWFKADYKNIEDAWKITSLHSICLTYSGTQDEKSLKYENEIAQAIKEIYEEHTSFKNFTIEQRDKFVNTKGYEEINKINEKFAKFIQKNYPEKLKSISDDELIKSRHRQRYIFFSPKCEILGIYEEYSEDEVDKMEKEHKVPFFIFSGDLDTHHLI